MLIDKQISIRDNISRKMDEFGTELLRSYTELGVILYGMLKDLLIFPQLLCTV